MKIKDFIKFVFFLSIGAGILTYMFKKTGISVSDFTASLDDINYALLGFSLLVLVFSHGLRAIRWQMQLEATNEKASFGATFSAIMAGYLINYGVPRSGEIIKCGLLAKHQKIPVPKVAGTAVTDRIIDVVLFAIICGGTFLLEFDLFYAYIQENAQIPDVQKYLMIGGLAIVVLAIVFFIFRKKIAATKIYKKVVELAIQFKQGLFSIKDLRRPYLYTFLSVVVWLCYILMHYTSLLAFAPTAHFGIQEVLIVFTFGSLGIIIPTPGGIGSFQFFVQQAIMIYAVSAQEAFIAANIIFWPFVVVNIFIGGIGLFYLTKSSSKTVTHG